MSQESILASWYKPGSPQKLPARTMPLGFYIIMAAQFFSALADNALLIVSIALLKDMQAPPQYEPMLKFFFTISYVALAAFVGAYADSMPKWRVMLISNTIKIRRLLNTHQHLTSYGDDESCLMNIHCAMYIWD